MDIEAFLSIVAIFIISAFMDEVMGYFTICFNLKFNSPPNLLDNHFARLCIGCCPPEMINLNERLPFAILDGHKQWTLRGRDY